MSAGTALRARLARWRGPLLWGLAAWAVLLAATALLWQRGLRDLQAAQQAELELQALDVKRQISRQLENHALLLKGFVGLFQASGQVSRADFRAFYESLGLDRADYGFAAVNFLEAVPGQQLPAHLARVRATDRRDYQVTPPGVRPQHAPILYIEPLASGNLRALGYDPWTVPTVREALERARDTGELALSGKLFLRQDAGQPTPSLTMALPVYRRNATPDTPQQRQQQLMGWVTSPFRVAELLRLAFIQQLGTLELEVFEGAEPRPDRLLFDSDPALGPGSGRTAGLRTHLPLTLGGQSWTLAFYAKPGFGASNARQPAYLAALGALLSTVLALLVAQAVALLQRRSQAAAQQLAQAQAQGRELARQAAQDALRQSEFRWRAAVQDLGDGLWDWNLRDDSVYFSEAWLSLFGIPAEQSGTAYTQWEERLHPQDRAHTLNSLHDYLEGRSDAYVCQYRIQRPDGQTLWLLDRGRIVERDALERPQRMLGTVQDITRHKRNELNLRESEFAARMALDRATTLSRELDRSRAELAQREEVYRSIVTQAVDGMVLVDALTLRFVEFNDAACQDLGYSREEFASLGVADIQAELDAPALQAQAQHMQTQAVIRFETRHRHKDGSLRDVAISGRAVWRDGHPFIVGIMADITERKAAEAELQRHRAHLEQLVAQRTAELQHSLARTEEALQALAQQKAELQWTVSLHNATLAATDQGIFVEDGYWRPTLWNRRFLELWGLQDADLQGPNLDAALVKVGAQLTDPGRLAYRVSADPAVSHFPPELLQLKDGRVLQRVCLPQTLNGAVVGRVWTYTDITHIKRAEQEALAANRAKSEFLANMSHEIRTPMNGVVGMVDILHETPLNPAQQQMLATIADSSLVLLNILNDILDYSKIESGMLQVEQLPTCLPAVTQGVLQLLRPSAQKKGVALSLALDPGLPEWVVADPTRLRQVLLNLVGNAIKFTVSTPERPGQVSLQVGPAQWPAGQPGLAFCVQDNGIGISPSQQARLFQPFTQADASTSRQFGGTGLGLSISRRLMHLMQGDLQMQSALGRGSRFTALLPLQAAPPGLQTGAGTACGASVDADWVVAGMVSGAAKTLAGPARALTPAEPTDPAAPAGAPAPVCGPRILLAEDNETNRDVLCEQLRLLGCQTDVAANGEEALGRIGTQRYDLLLTDCHMPRMDGYALCAAIRMNEAPGQRLPIVAVTAGAMMGEVERCKAAGMDDYLSKPLRLQALRAMLQRWLPQAMTPGADPSPSPSPSSSPALRAPEPPLPADRLADAAPVQAAQAPHTAVQTVSAASATPLWSPGVMTELMGYNPTLHKRLLLRFLNKSQTQTPQIAQAVQASQWPQAAALAHTLKSAARQVGALALGECAERLEAAALAADAPVCALHSELLQDTWQRTVALLAAGAETLTDEALSGSVGSAGEVAEPAEPAEPADAAAFSPPAGTGVPGR